MSAVDTQQPIHYEFNGSPSVKDAIEAMGVPHPEVMAIIVNQAAVDFRYNLNADDRVDVYPVSDPAPVTTHSQLPYKPAAKPGFILDVHLGKLARYLRIAGFDTLYDAVDAGDEHIARIAQDENRILLTRDKGLLKRAEVMYGHWLRHTDSRAQLREVITHYGLRTYIQAFSRCVHCNGRIEAVAKTSIAHRLPPRVKQSLDEFYQCSQCKHIYWKGSHYSHINQFLHSL